METNQNGPLVLRDVQHLPLEMLNPTLVFGVVVPLTPIVVTAQHQMIFVMVVENAVTGNKCAGLLLQGWSPVLLRILTVTLSHPLTTSHMMYVKSHLHLRESLWILTSVLLQSHNVLNGSDSRLTLAALVTLYMSQTSTSSPLYKWPHLLSASLTTQRQSSQLQGKLHYSALVVGKHMSL